MFPVRVEDPATASSFATPSSQRESEANPSPDSDLEEQWRERRPRPGRKRRQPGPSLGSCAATVDRTVAAQHIFWNSPTMQRSKTRRGMKVGPKFTPGTPKRTPRGPRRAKMEPEITPRGSQGRPRVSSGEPARLPGTPERARRGPRSTPGHDSGAEGNLLNPQNEALASMGAMFCKNDHIGKLFQQ